MLDIENKFQINIPNYALAVMDALHKAGEEAYIVGGCVRDALLGLTPHDYDMAVSSAPERTLEILKDFRTIATGLQHGTVTAISEGNPIELTTFRVDGSYSDSRRPDSVSFTRSLSKDLARRDFTVNAIAYSPSRGLIDLFGGREDIQARVIRAVGEPKLRFGEDALRIMRAFRFSAQLGFTIDKNTLAGARECRRGLSNVARERIGVEFIRLLTSAAPENALCLMRENGILEYVSEGYAPNDRVFKLLASMPPNDTARLGFFLCYAEEALARRVLAGLRCSNRQKSGALAIAREAHTKIKAARDARLLRSRIGEHAADAVRASVLLGISDRKAVELVEGDTSAVSIGQLKIDGKDLEAKGFMGREIGKELSRLLALVIEEPELNQRERLLALSEKEIKEKKERE